MQLANASLLELRPRVLRTAFEHLSTAWAPKALATAVKARKQADGLLLSEYRGKGQGAGEFQATGIGASGAWRAMLPGDSIHHGVHTGSSMEFISVTRGPPPPLTDPRWAALVEWLNATGITGTARGLQRSIAMALRLQDQCVV